MKSKYILFLTFIISFPTFSAADNRVSVYSETKEKSGATIIVNESSEQRVDARGTIEIENSHHRIRDPIGLMNRTSESVNTVSKIRASGDRSETVASVDTNGTSRTYSTDTEVKKHRTGGKTEVVKSREVVDPKGLMNKQTTEIKEEVERKEDGSMVSRTLTTEIDGKLVSEERQELK